MLKYECPTLPQTRDLDMALNPFPHAIDSTDHMLRVWNGSDADAPKCIVVHYSGRGSDALGLGFYRLSSDLLDGDSDTYRGLSTSKQQIPGLDRKVTE